MTNKKAVCLLIEKDGKYLGVARRDDHSAFGLPGGKVDPGETHVESAVRELQEETGLKVSPQDLKVVFERTCDGDTPYDSTTYSASKWAGEPTRGDAGPVRWVTRAELEAGPFGKYNKKLFNKIDEK